MLEALILWQVVQARSEARPAKSAGQDSLVAMLFIQFVITVMIWPVNAVYRLGLWKLSKPVAISVAVVIATFMGIGFTAIYILVGIVWAGIEAAVWVEKMARLEAER